MRHTHLYARQLFFHLSYEFRKPHEFRAHVREIHHPSRMVAYFARIINFVWHRESSSLLRRHLLWCWVFIHTAWVSCVGEGEEKIRGLIQPEFFLSSTQLTQVVCINTQYHKRCLRRRQGIVHLTENNSPQSFKKNINSVYIAKFFS